MANWREHLSLRETPTGRGSVRAVLIGHVAPPIWDEASAIVAPMPSPVLQLPESPAERMLGGELPLSRISYAILTLDREYIRREMLPALAERHFGHGSRELDYQVAVVPADGRRGIVYASTPGFSPLPDARVDASADFFQVRAQDFGAVAADVRRFTAVPARAGRGRAGFGRGAVGPDRAARTTALFDLHSNRCGWGHQHEAHPDAVCRARRAAVEADAPASLGLARGGCGQRAPAQSPCEHERARRARRQQLEFVAAVSHELRTPLAVIRSAADNLAEGVVDDRQQVRKYGELMRGEGRRLTEMVEQILELSGIQSGQRGFALCAVAIEPLVHEVLAASASLIEDAGPGVEVSMPLDLPAVLGDEPALRRVFQNLLGNAIKYGSDGRWIGVSAAAAGGEVRITVADRGMGIPPAEQARVFEPFYRAGAAVAAQIHGAGLGLSLVQRIVEAHGGRVSLTSAPGKGSAFTVHLPAASGVGEALPRVAQPGADPAAAAPGSNLAGAPRCS